eukprot:CAMPEP_0201739028 /NCGR_PEP_ID=MMETSP0593-20130828/45561_1 /ASSEMBLY_ACC=CAM_ASM_000672 /TAXON_ID=267983 /ORGANISM="Skeletonema japonicum, Strain CCMP2506" /LENGTH=715 /DNA_ID=CAMNT_0048233265 /DNA_START=5 /DNA_END=2152 /DNA_ORIENTATION=+
MAAGPSALTDNVDDSDLEDLITKESPNNNNGSMNIEAHKTTTTHNMWSSTPLSCICGWISLCNYTFPRLSKCILLLLTFTLLSILFSSTSIFNPTINNHKMGGDYSAIQTAYDLSLSQVDHWCVRGDNDSCRCEDPLEPSPRSEFKSWVAAHKANVAEVNLYRALFGENPSMVDEELGGGRARPKIDVAFLGESVVEAMDGRWLGKHIIGSFRKNKQQQQQEGEEKKKEELPMIHETFEKLFCKDKGGELEGVALGIAGDTTSNVLWRIMNDEMPYDFNPKVWWLVLGMNDLTRMQCSEEIVVLGILRVVEEIRLRKPDAKIVINSLLPMINYQDGMGETKMADVADFTADRSGGGGRKYRKKEERYREERKREVPSTFQVRDQDDSNNGKRRLSRVKQREDETDEEFEERRMKRNKKRQENRERNGDDDDEEKTKKKLTKKQREEVEDNATEGPDLEKAIERKKKILDKEDKRIRQKAFKDDEKFHPKKPVSKFLPMIKKKVLPPVWPSVHLINDKLKEFCTKHDSITFFDATEFFASKEEGGRHHLYNELISPRGHPTELGFQRWEGGIRYHLNHLITPEPDTPEPTSTQDTDYVDDDRVEDGGTQVVDEGVTIEEEEDEEDSDDDDHVEVVSKGATAEEDTDDTPPAADIEVVSKGATAEEDTDDTPPAAAAAAAAGQDDDEADDDEDGGNVVPARSFEESDEAAEDGEEDE